MKRIIALWAIIIALPVALTAQTRIIRGTVLDKSGNQPLNGVTVQASGVAASTDAGGNFSIAVSTNTLLTFSYIGYATQQVKADTLRESITVWLSATDNSLDAVVVTALGISKQKKSLGYATQELKAKDISEAKEANVVNALAGKVAGVRVTNTQGDMGSSRIVIRGETSIANNNQPLFIVDGVPVDNSQLGAGGSRDYRNAIADLNSEDIENISVLKGPNAAALYGSRAAHGVILIKTKDR